MPTKAHRASNAITIIIDIWSWVIDKLKDGWSPEQITGFHGGISHMSIYRYIWTDKRKGGKLTSLSGCYIMEDSL